MQLEIHNKGTPWVGVVVDNPKWVPVYGYSHRLWVTVTGHVLDI